MRIDLALAAVEVGADKVNRFEPFRRFHRFELLEGNIRLAGILLDNIARPLIEIIAGRDAVLIEQAIGIVERTEKAAVIIEEFFKIHRRQNFGYVGRAAAQADQQRGDSARRGAGGLLDLWHDAFGFQQFQRTAIGDAFYAAAFKDQIFELIVHDISSLLV